MVERVRNNLEMQGVNLSSLMYVKTKITALSNEKKENLFGHDLRKDWITEVCLLAEIPIEGVVFTKKRKRYEEDPIADIKDLSRYSLGAVNFIRRNKETLAPFYDGDLEKLLPLVSVLARSSLFLAEPTPENYSHLLTSKIKAKDLGEMCGCDVTDIPNNVLLNGMDAIIAYNATKNAIKYGENNQATFRLHENNLRVENTSLKDLPAGFLSFGVGEGTGMGMGIIEVYSSVQGRSPNISHDLLSDGRYNISVSIPVLQTS